MVGKGPLLEKINGRYAGIEDLQRCEDALRRIHARGLIHGDTNRHNFIIRGSDTYVVDFGNAHESQDLAEMEAELASLLEQLMEESGRGKPRGVK